MSTDWGIPQVRDRVYIVFVRTDCMAYPSGRAEKIFDDVILASKADPKACSTSFTQFLEDCGLPVPRQVLLPGKKLQWKCSCDWKKVCNRHTCGCGRCKTPRGASDLGCRWRRHTAEYIQTTKNKRRTMLEMWRKLRRNPKLARAPSFFELSTKLGLNTDARILRPRERCMLNSMASTMNILKPDTVIDLSQSIDRRVIRADGFVPTLSTGCSRLLVTNRGSFLDASQCLALQGINPKPFQELNLSQEDLFHMAGNAMCLPVVGSIILAAGQLMQW